MGYIKTDWYILILYYNGFMLIDVHEFYNLIQLLFYCTLLIY